MAQCFPTENVIHAAVIPGKATQGKGPGGSATQETAGKGSAAPRGRPRRPVHRDSGAFTWNFPRLQGRLFSRVKRVWLSSGEGRAHERGAVQPQSRRVSESEVPRVPHPSPWGWTGEGGPPPKEDGGAEPSTLVLVGSRGRRDRCPCLWPLLPTGFAQAICSAHGLGNASPGPGSPMRVHTPRNPGAQEQGPAGRTPGRVSCSEGAAAGWTGGPPAQGLSPREERRRG